MEYLSSLWSAVWGSGSVPETAVPEPVATAAVHEPEVKVPEPVAVAVPPVGVVPPVQGPAARKRTRKQRLREQWCADDEDQDQLEAGKTIALLDEFYWRGRNGGLSSTIPTVEYDLDDKPLERQHKHRDRIPARHARHSRQKFTVKKRFELSEHRQRYHRPPQPIVPDHVHITDEFRRHHNLFLAPPIQVKKDRYVPRAAEKELIAQNFL